MYEKPRTAEQARILFRQIVRDLPEAERDRLIFFAGIADRPDTAEDAIQFLIEIVSRLSDDELSGMNTEIALEGRKERIFILSLALAMGDWTVIPNEDGTDPLVVLTAGAWQNLLNATERKKKDLERKEEWSLQTLHKITKEVLEEGADIAERKRKLRRCHDARKTTTTRRKEAIDALLDEGHLHSEIYGQMRLKHESLMKGRGKNYMNEDSMWDSYKNVGGCHPKAVRPKGRPKEK